MSDRAHADATVQFDLGRALAAQGKLGQAASQFERAIALQPDFIDAYHGLALSYLQQGRSDPALGVLRRAIGIGGAAESKALFVQVLRSLSGVPDLDDLREQIARALSEPWTRPSAVAPIAAALIRHDETIKFFVDRANAAWPQRLPPRELLGSAGLATIGSHRLLAALLPATPVSDVVLERFLTALRFVLLELASAETTAADAVRVRLSCLLARQCFLNEYVLARVGDEHDRARRLRDRLTAAISAGAAIPEAWIASVASYFPLHSLPEADALFDGAWSESVTAVLVQQLREPEAERQLRATIPTLTAIRDKISLVVREQYEKNPYPRWVKPAPPVRPLTIEQFLRREFPLAPVCARAPRETLDILVAGCGTGQEAIETAQQFSPARVLAIDLSMASLAYGARKTRELGIAGIDYAQADILELGSFDRSFDLIMAGGVLHHLADPFAGWRLLFALLRPAGVMRVGFYSELARAHVKAARAFIAECGYRPTTDDIRRCRQDLLGAPDGSLLKTVTRAEDFFTTSECRDLLFHAQERRHTLPEIAAFLADSGLTFLGFDLSAAVRQHYRARFPADAAMTDLACWDAFERENPDTFVGMYQFWVQKTAERNGNPGHERWRPVAHREATTTSALSSKADVNATAGMPAKGH